MPFNKLLRSRIFTPLGMNDSYLHNERFYPSVVNNMYRHRKEMPKEEKLNFIYGDKGIYSTVADLRKWDKALNENQLITASSLKTALTKGTTNSGKTFDYGFGWRIGQTYNGARITAHWGLWQSYNPAIIRMPDSKTSIIMLTHPNKPFNSLNLLNPMLAEVTRKIRPSLNWADGGRYSVNEDQVRALAR